MTVVKRVKGDGVTARACEYCWSHARGTSPLLARYVYGQSVGRLGTADLKRRVPSRVLRSHGPSIGVCTRRHNRSKEPTPYPATHAAHQSDEPKSNKVHYRCEKVGSIYHQNHLTIIGLVHTYYIYPNQPLLGGRAAVKSDRRLTLAG